MGRHCRACGQGERWCSVYTSCSLNKGKEHDLTFYSPDPYKSAWEEINMSYDRAIKLLGPEYLGWNWVHALVDKLEKLEKK